MTLLESLQRATRESSGLSLRAELRALNSRPGDAWQHVFPPTFAKDRGDDSPPHLFIGPLPGGHYQLVILDTPQSFANRLEDALVSRYDLPKIQTTVGDEVLSSFSVPHRVFDAILRDSELDGQPFRKTEVGQALIGASAKMATAMFRYAPHVLLLGGWDSQGEAGGMGRKWARALSCEIVGLDALPAQAAGGRLDPLGIRSAVQVVGTAEEWQLAGPKDKGTTNPSSVGHSNVPPSIAARGALVRNIEVRGALSLTRLRRYSFPLDAGTNPLRDEAARTALAALAVSGVTDLLSGGLDLRSGAELAVSSLTWSVAGFESDEALTVTVESAREAYHGAIEQCRALGLEFGPTLSLQASEKLTALVKRSRALAPSDADD